MYNILICDDERDNRAEYAKEVILTVFGLVIFE